MTELTEDSKRDNWANRTGFNVMCYQCPILLSKCIGSKNKTWEICQRRNSVEREREKWQDSEHRTIF